jgi:FKBP-type peptidyl-prolyl cis-trans isomerase FklB
MKKTALTVALVLSVAAPLLADGTNELADAKSRTSYAIGVAVGRNLAHTLQVQDVQVDSDIVARAVKDVLSSNATLLTADEIQQTLATLQTEVQTRAQARQLDLAATNLVLAQAFLVSNKTNPGVVTMPDGLQYKVISQGDGEIPGDNNIVEASFRGTLLDGREWENRSQPVQVPVGTVSPQGFSEALKLMKTGSKWRLFIPPDLAFGQNGMAPRIPPNSVLIMDVELVSVVRPNQSSAAASAPAANPPLTSDIIKVPSAEELKQGAKVEIIKQEDLQKLQQQQQQQQSSPAK